MSKRSEAAALKAYPKDRKGVLYDLVRKSIIQGYEQAEKDTIERVVKWLQSHIEEYIMDLTPDPHAAADAIFVIGGRCWLDLQKAMEEE